MKQVWTVFVLFWYINGIDKLLIIRADQKTLYSSEVPAKITCAYPAVIQVEKADIVGENSTCSKKCVLNESDFHTIQERCNDANECIVDFPNNTFCLRETRYFNLSYSCSVATNMACNFESSLCNWRPVLDNNDVIWQTHSPLTPPQSNKALPNVDHTTNSNMGYYLLMVSSPSQKTRVAAVKSGDISFNGDKCLDIWYNMDDSSYLRIYKSTLGDEPLLLWENKNRSKNWEHVNVSLIMDLPYEIVIEGTVGPNSHAYIAIDDTDIRDWSCNESQSVSCNFEENFCEFKLEPPNPTHPWRRVKTGDPSIGRPAFDHTKENGYYVFTQSINSNPENRRRITIPVGNKLEVGCLSLWYYMFGYIPGHLNINIVRSMTEEYLTIIKPSKKNRWSQFRSNVYNVTHIVFEYIFTIKNLGGIAIDDVYISPIICKDHQISNECVKNNKQMHIQCPVSYLWNETIAFDPKIPDYCTTTADQVYRNIQNILNSCDDEVMCAFTPAEIIGDEMCINMSKSLLLDYSCIDKSVSVTTSTRVVSSTTHTNAIDATFFTTLDRQTISIATSQQTGDIKDGNQSSSQSSTSVIGIVLGVLLSLIALSVVLVIAVVYFRRYSYAKKKGHSIVVNEDSHSDYTGHQNTAFSPEVNVTTQTDYCEIRTSKHNDQYHDITDVFSPSIHTTNDDEYSEIANVVNSPNNPNASANYQHQYISLDPNATGFDRSIPQNNLHNESKNNHNSNEKTSFMGGDDYALLDPDESKNNTPKILPLSENYVVLDPNETGFNRQENTDTVCNYEPATPINPTVTSEDPYGVSKDEIYDTSSNSRHKEKENNIYSHMVDNVYDTAGNQRKKEDSDGTYDHFFGQQSEDDYDISKPL